MIITKNTSEQLEELLDEGLTLVDVYAVWCGPCRMISPNIEEVSNKLGIKVIKVDVDKNLDVASKYQINSIPALLLFKNKKLVSSSLGYMETEEIEKWILMNK